MNVSERVISVIEFMAKDNQLHGTSEVARELGLSKATTFRILHDLARLKWMDKDDKTRKYRLGPQAACVTPILTSHLVLEEVSLPFMYDLCEITNESAMLSQKVGWSRVFIEQVESKQELRQRVELRKRLPQWCGAVGTAMLAFMEPAESESFISHHFAGVDSKLSPTGKVITIENLRRELREIRETGFAVSSEACLAGAIAVAAPIFGQNHQVIGSISVIGPKSRFTFETARHHGALLKQVAETISLRLGGTGPKIG
jgi:DNA-binding IclR family transcriptional regulator